MKRAAPYTRVSSIHKEEDGKSMATQRASCEALANRSRVVKEKQRVPTTTMRAISASITAALMRGAKFIVDEKDRITVTNPDSIPPVDRDKLRNNWSVAKAAILQREHDIRSATPYLCPECGFEVARWVGNHIWLPGFHMGWGERGWANQGQAIPIINCKQCGHRWWIEYPGPMDGRL